MKLEPESEKINLQTSIQTVKPHGIILSLSNPGPEEFSFLKKIIEIPQVPGVIVTSNYMTAAQAVSCMRFGAYDCLTGPANGEVIAACLKRMIHPKLSESESEEKKAEPLLAGNSPAVNALRSRLQKFSKLPYPVLISGETGSGKELAAKTIHSLGNRCQKPFTAVNCASFNDDLLGSEMFGSTSGAFTGSTNRAGLFEITTGGTLFLDEIAEFSLRAQASLLRVIEDGYIRRVGSHKTKPVNVRIIAATNKDLRLCIRQGTFRNDLFFRLNLLEVTVPPLRERKEDIPRLCRDYLQTLPEGNRWRIENSALSVLVRYRWPGNVRELQAVLLKASLTAVNFRLKAGDISLTLSEGTHE